MNSAAIRVGVRLRITGWKVGRVTSFGAIVRNAQQLHKIA